MKLTKFMRTFSMVASYVGAMGAGAFLAVMIEYNSIHSLLISGALLGIALAVIGRVSEKRAEAQLLEQRELVLDVDDSEFEFVDND